MAYEGAIVLISKGFGMSVEACGHFHGNETETFRIAQRQDLKEVFLNIS